MAAKTMTKEDFKANLMAKLDAKKDKQAATPKATKKTTKAPKKEEKIAEQPEQQPAEILEIIPEEIKTHLKEEKQREKTPKAPREKEKYQNASNILLDRETGEQTNELTADMITQRFIKHAGIARNEFAITNYTCEGGEEMNHNFSKIYGIKFSSWEIEQIKKPEMLQGEIITFSADSGNNHFIIIKPYTKGILMRGINGQEIMITPENYLDHYITITRHGRLYNWARILSYEYKLKYMDLPNGKYTLSNKHNWNFTLDKENFRLYGLNGITRAAANPFEYITGQTDISLILK
jgi:hypothetical protein